MSMLTVSEIYQNLLEEANQLGVTRSMDHIDPVFEQWVNEHFELVEDFTPYLILEAGYVYATTHNPMTAVVIVSQIEQLIDSQLYGKFINETVSFTGIWAARKVARREHYVDTAIWYAEQFNVAHHLLELLNSYSLGQEEDASEAIFSTLSTDQKTPALLVLASLLAAIHLHEEYEKIGPKMKIIYYYYSRMLTKFRAIKENMHGTDTEIPAYLEKMRNIEHQTRRNHINFSELLQPVYTELQAALNREEVIQLIVREQVDLAWLHLMSTNEGLPEDNFTVLLAGQQIGRNDHKNALELISYFSKTSNNPNTDSERMELATVELAELSSRIVIEDGFLAETAQRFARPFGMSETVSQFISFAGAASITDEHFTAAITEWYQTVPADVAAFTIAALAAAVMSDPIHTERFWIAASVAISTI